MANEKLVQYRFDLASDLLLVGHTSPHKIEYFDTLLDDELWQSTREAIAYDTPTASFDFGVVQPTEMRTKFGKSLIYLIQTAPEMSLAHSSRSTDNTGCGLAEPGFMKSLRPHTHKQFAPILLETDGNISAMMKFNSGGENTLLSLNDDDKLIQGGVYSLASDVEAKVRDVRPQSGLMIAAANDFYELIPDIRPIRQSSFMIDDEIRTEFAKSLNKGPNDILGIRNMQHWADTVATFDEQASRRRGAELLERLNDDRN